MNHVHLQGADLYSPTPRWRRLPTGSVRGRRLEEG